LIFCVNVNQIHFYSLTRKQLNSKQHQLITFFSPSFIPIFAFLNSSSSIVIMMRVLVCGFLSLVIFQVAQSKSNSKKIFILAWFLLVKFVISIGLQCYTCLSGQCLTDESIGITTVCPSELINPVCFVINLG